MLSLRIISALALLAASVLAAPVDVGLRQFGDAECQGKAVGDACTTTSTVTGTLQGFCINSIDEGVVDPNFIFCNAGDFVGSSYGP
ncbi:hypothetical protein B0H16DRAFT_1567908 [Mycena metata]|uniref:Uncharacterized protein n=1 Tax=Mycena metata TaxID=1033252 RepID=A0AAD7MZF1_9AGAR|nr:hypothetical protein B0H16DRAFT_1567908 [Mycena metata]